MLINEDLLYIIKQNNDRSMCVLYVNVWSVRNGVQTTIFYRLEFLTQNQTDDKSDFLPRKAFFVFFLRRYLKRQKERTHLRLSNEASSIIIDAEMEKINFAKNTKSEERRSLRQKISTTKALEKNLNVQKFVNSLFHDLKSFVCTTVQKPGTR